MTTKRRATSADVARAAGVSRTTVSFVLNNTPDQTIAPATRQRVIQAARDLGYVPSPAGLALVKGRTDVVILDLAWMPLGEYHLARFASAFTGRLEPAGATVIVNGPDHASAGSLLRLARAIQPFAVVSFDQHLAEMADSLRQAGVQFIQGLDAATTDSGFDWTRQGAKLQLGHLATRGHQTIGFARSPQPQFKVMGGQRYQGLAAEAAGCGVTLVPAFDLDPERDVTRGLVERWRAEYPAATAIVAFNDNAALALLAALWDLGVKVPEEMAVIGMDDIPNARFAIPALTTLRPSVADGADYLATRLLQAMGHETEDFPNPDSPMFSLVVRDST